MKNTVVVLLLIIGVQSYAQGISKVWLTKWKDNAKGAYSIIHDDYCMYTSRGIALHADSVASNRSIPISFAVVTAHCDSGEWDTANSMIERGHEVHNHSHNHFCGLPVTWCPNNYYKRENYKTEYDLSERLIKENTGSHSEFYVFPYDLINDTMVNYVKDSLKLMGARSGKQNVINQPDSIENFGVRFHILRPEQNNLALDTLVMQAIDSEGWAVRGCHGVEDDSWGSIPLKDYIRHLDFVKSKVDKGLLWVTTPVRILKYNACKQATKLSIKGNKILIVNNSKVNAEELTMRVKVKGDYSFYQQNKKLKSRESKGMYFVNFIPKDGTIVMK